MKAFLNTYIAAAPWRAILLYGVFFAFVCGGLNLLVRYRNEPDLLTERWTGELAMWFIAGMFARYVTWRAEGALERRNERWKAKKKSER